MTKRREGRHENTSLLALGEARAGRMSIHFCFLPFAALLVKREIWSDSYRRHLVSNNYSSVVTLYLHHTVQVRQPVAMDVGEVEKKGLCIDSRAQDAHAVGK